MDIFISIIKMLGGLALLIYGMEILSSNLKKLSGSKLEKILSSATSNSFKGLLVGFVITAATQSSAATTVIVVGLVNSGILSLRKSIPIIMGANIGTTLTAQILRFADAESSSWISLFTPATLAPIIIIMGLIATERAKSAKSKDIGQMIMGLGLLFTGMITMVNVASTFSDLPILSKVLEKLSNPLLGVLAGTLITALVQSSSATIGILQALSTTGVIKYATTIPIILGQNIGTCITSILASIGGNTNAKRVAAVHLYFNLIGTLIFLIVIYSYQYLVGFSFWNDTVDMGKIADFHLLFNVISTLVLFPFIKQIEKLTLLTIRDGKKEEDDDSNDYLTVLNQLDERVTKIPKLAITSSKNVIEKMGEIAEKNFRRSKELIDNFDSKKLNHIKDREDVLDKMEEVVTNFLIKIENLDLSKKENSEVTSLLKVESDYEKIGDYSFHFSKIVESMYDKKISLSPQANLEIGNMYKIVREMIKKTSIIFKEQKVDLNIDVEVLRELVDIKSNAYKSVHIKRLKSGICNVESGIAYLEMITICENISRHCSNISITMTNYINDDEITTKKEFRKKINTDNNKLFESKLRKLKIKYKDQ